jgi:LmbE family N-acetylglucosaminyl deacetylase
MLLARSDHADYHVDIEPVLRKKVRALLAHESQMRGRTPEDLLRMWRARARTQSDDDGGDPVFRESFARVILRR